MRVKQHNGRYSGAAQARAWALLATLAALLLVTLHPAAALAAPDSLASRTRGSILIRYSKDYASYDVYRIFDLAASTNGTSVQEDDTYDYVIKETAGASSATHDTSVNVNPWWTFLTTYGPDGQDSATPYAVLSTEASSQKKVSALFIIDAPPITVGGEDGYHVVTVTDRYLGMDDFVMRGSQPAGETAGTTTARAQDFVRAALAFADVQRITTRAGHYVARGRENYGNTVGQTNTDSVYQYSGDTAYVTNISLGVYLLAVNEGMLCSMDVGDTSALVYDRKEYPELFVQVRAKDAPATVVALDRMDSGEQNDLVWSEENLTRWVYRTDVNLGQLVQFKTVIIAQEGVTDYRLHDVMEYGLTFIDGSADPTYSPRVYFHSQASGTTHEVLGTVDGLTNWVLHTRGDAEDAPVDLCDFEVEFKDVASTSANGSEEKLTFAFEQTGEDGVARIAMKDVADWDRIVVTYWAQVNDNAVVYGSDRSAKAVRRAKDLTQVRGGSSGTGEQLLVQTHARTDGNSRNTNSAVLTYGEDSHTTWARAEVASYQFDVVRTDAATSGGYPLLAGAQLALYKTVDAGVAGAVAYAADVNHEQKTYYYLPDEPLQFLVTSEVYTYTQGMPQGESAGTALTLGDGNSGEGADASNASNAAQDAAASGTNGATVQSDAGSPTASLTASGDASSATTTQTSQQTEPVLTTTLVSSSASVLRVRGIEAGTYLLVESVAPEGSALTRQPIVVTVHSRAYNNNDPVEDNTPGLRHSNAEGDITVTSLNAGGTSATEVYRWKAKVGGEPAVYKRDTIARTSSTQTARTTPTSSTKSTSTNGGVLVSNREASKSGASAGTNILAICAAVVAIFVCIAAAIGVRRLRTRA